MKLIMDDNDVDGPTDETLPVNNKVGWNGSIPDGRMETLEHVCIFMFYSQYENINVFDINLRIY